MVLDYLSTGHDRRYSGWRQRVRRTEMIMGTAITVEIVGAAPSVLDSVFTWFIEVDCRFSTYKPDSEVCRYDRGEVDFADLSADAAIVLGECEQLRVQTEGFFDAYATGVLDPSGYVKGWSVQVAADRLLAHGINDFCLNAGGDIRLHGSGTRGSWRIGIRHPWQADALAWVISGTDLAIATSGSYERGPHVVDPVHHRPVTFLRSVTVVGPDLGVADAYATAVMAMGRAGLEWMAGRSGYSFAAVAEDGQAYVSTDFPQVDP